MAVGDPCGFPRVLMRRRRRTVVYFACAAVATVLLFFVAPLRVDPFARGVPLVMQAAMWTAVLILHLALRRREKRFVERVRGLDYRVCPSCGYLLTGLPDSGKCPECGEDYELQKLRDIWRHADD